MTQIVFAAFGAIAIAGLYLAGRVVRKIIAWLNRSTGPCERAIPYAFIFAMAGGIAGWFAYGPYVLAQQCYAAGKPVISCTLFPI